MNQNTVENKPQLAVGSLCWDIQQFTAIEDKPNQQLAIADCILTMASIFSDERTLAVARKHFKDVLPGEKVAKCAVSAFITEWKIDVLGMSAQKSLQNSTIEYFNGHYKAVLAGLSQLNTSVSDSDKVALFTKGCKLNYEVVGQLAASGIVVSPLNAELMSDFYKHLFVNVPSMIKPV